MNTTRTSSLVLAFALLAGAVAAQTAIPNGLDLTGGFTMEPDFSVVGYAQTPTPTSGPDAGIVPPEVVAFSILPLPNQSPTNPVTYALGVDTVQISHVESAGPPPTIWIGEASGVGATCTITGDDHAGLIEITGGQFGGDASIVSVATVIFAEPYRSPPKAVILTPASPSSSEQWGNCKVYVPNVIGIETIQYDGFFLCVGPYGSLEPGVQYYWHYVVE
jgi:hypothetical protein